MSSIITIKALRGVWGSGPTDVHAAGEDGVLYRFDGSKWKPETSPTKIAVNALHGAGGEVRAVGDLGTMLLRKGGKWTMTSFSLTQNDLGAIRGSSPTDVVAVGYAGTALHFDGKGWTARATGTTNHNMRGLWAAGGGSYWAVGYTHPGSPKPVAQYFNGSSWTMAPVPTSSGTLTDVWGAGGKVFAVGNASKGAMVILEKAGISWKLITPGINGTGYGSNAIWGRSATDVYIAGKSNTVLHRDATSWKALSPPGGCGGYTSVWGTGSSTVFFTSATSCCAGCSMRLQNGFWKSWKTSTFMAGVWGTGPTNVFAVGDKGTLQRFDGLQWNTEAIGTGLPFPDIWGTSATNVFIVGSNGMILHRGK